MLQIENVSLTALQSGNKKKNHEKFHHVDARMHTHTPAQTHFMF